jgi:hypothetical protein
MIPETGREDKPGARGLASHRASRRRGWKATGRPAAVPAASRVPGLLRLRFHDGLRSRPSRPCLGPAGDPLATRSGRDARAPATSGCTARLACRAGMEPGPGRYWRGFGRAWHGGLPRRCPRRPMHLLMPWRARLRPSRPFRAPDQRGLPCPSALTEQRPPARLGVPARDSKIIPALHEPAHALEGEAPSEPPFSCAGPAWLAMPFGADGAAPPSTARGPGA